MDDFTRSGGYYRLQERIASIDKPTLIIWGERDEVVGTQAAYQFQTAIASSRLVWLPQGHFPQLEQPKLLARRILQFITR
jgi:pimeloyl-ACP methyl ester carboxylesterase